MHAQRASIASNNPTARTGRLSPVACATPTDAASPRAASDAPTPTPTLPEILQTLLRQSPDGILNIPPSLAARILDEMNFPGQRKRKTFRVGEHQARIRKGHWNPEYPITLVQMPEGTMWLADGQHRMEAIAQSGTPIAVRINRMRAADEHEARRIYAGFDRPEYIRTQEEMLTGLGVTAQTGLKQRTVRSLFRALPIILNNMEHARSNQEHAAAARSVEARIDLLPEWTPEAARYEAIFNSAETALKAPLYGAGVMAVALYVMRYQPARAEEFWRGVIAGSALNKDDPRQRLMWDLLNRNLNVGALRQGIQMTALAWTRWCEGARMKMIRCTEGAPIVIWGTPLAKGRRS